ncbi:serine hydrolase [Streptomyces longwoodensis]|uniref:serine hydrolase n=1 Tax=Streptomyces longwoodensis TaxID=68231 RepID=UPI0033E372D8
MILPRSWSTAAVLALVVSPLPVAASAAPRPSGTAWSVQRDADALRDTGVTGVAVRLETPRGTVTARSGVGDLATRRPVAADGYLRLGSTTKTFVATVMLQLVGEKLGHGGNGFGYVIRAATTTDGRSTVTVSAHSRSADPRTAARQEDALRALIDHALCRIG